MIPAGYQIARADPHELADLPAIEIAAGAIFPPEDLAPELVEKGPPISIFEKASQDGHLWVVRSLEPLAPVGFALVILLNGSAHLYEIDVHPDHGRRGLGRELVLHVAQWARTSGFETLTLTTFRHLRWNAPFYSSLGFSEIAARDMGADLRAIVSRESEDGFDPIKRVAMRLDLHAS